MKEKEQTLSFSIPIEITEFDLFEEFIQKVISMIGKHGKLIDAQIGQGDQIMQLNKEGLDFPENASIKKYAKEGLVTHGFTFLATDGQFSEVMMKFMTLQADLESDLKKADLIY